MEKGEFGVECEECECSTCIKNDDAICQNCNKCNGCCNGCMNYNRWKIDCKKYKECKNPEENIKIILGNI